MASFIGERMGTSVAIAEGSRHAWASTMPGWLSLHGIVAESSKRTISRVELEVPDNWVESWAEV